MPEQRAPCHSAPPSPRRPRRAAPAPAASCPRACRRCAPARASRARTACRSSAGCVPSTTLVASTGQKRDESGVSTSSISISVPSSSRPNSNLVSAMMMPRVERDRRRLAVEARSRCRGPARRARRRRSRSRASKSMFSSWSPISALVAGVKIGAGSLLAFCRPGGSGTPQTAPALLVLLPAAAGQVAAHHRLDRHRLQALDQHRAAAHLRALVRRRPRSRVARR